MSLCRFKFCVAGFVLKIFSLQKSATQSITHAAIILNVLSFFCLFHISQLIHFLVINSAIRKFSETTQIGRALYAYFLLGPALFWR